MDDENDSVDPVESFVPGLPAGLTRAGEEAWRDVLETASGALSAELRRRGRTRRELTGDDVYAAWAGVVRGMDTSPPRASASALGAGLMVIGSVGVGSMHPYLHSPLQIALLVLFAVLGLTGFGLTLHGGRGADGATQAAG